MHNPCWASNMTCYGCGQQGHVKVACQTHRYAGNRPRGGGRQQWNGNNNPRWQNDNGRGNYGQYYQQGQAGQGDQYQQGQAGQGGQYQQAPQQQSYAGAVQNGPQGGQQNQA